MQKIGERPIATHGGLCRMWVRRLQLQYDLSSTSWTKNKSWNNHTSFIWHLQIKRSYQNNKKLTRPHVIYIPLFSHFFQYNHIILFPSKALSVPTKAGYYLLEEVLRLKWFSSMNTELQILINLSASSNNISNTKELTVNKTKKEHVSRSWGLLLKWNLEYRIW